MDGGPSISEILDLNRQFKALCLAASWKCLAACWKLLHDACDMK